MNMEHMEPLSRSATAYKYWSLEYKSNAYGAVKDSCETGGDPARVACEGARYTICKHRNEDFRVCHEYS